MANSFNKMIDEKIIKRGKTSLLMQVLKNSVTETVRSAEHLQDDYQEPARITCEICGRSTSHPEGWHYCGGKGASRD